MPLQPPGYSDGIHYLSDRNFTDGLYRLQCEVRDGQQYSGGSNHEEWLVAPGVIKALADITKRIYVVLPAEAKPIFNPAILDPGVVVTTKDVIKALRKHYGYVAVGGAKHVKLERPGHKPIELQRSRDIVVPHIAKQILQAVTGQPQPLERLRDLLDGSLGLAQ